MTKLIPASRNIISLLKITLGVFFSCVAVEKLASQEVNTFYQSYAYNITVPQVEITKENLGLITGGLVVYDQYLTASGFKFRLTVPVNMEERLSDLGIPFTGIESSKESAAMFSLEKAGGNNCELAQQLCSNASQSGNSSGAGTQELNSGNHGCLATNEHQSSWYYLNVATGGNLTMLIDPSTNSSDYDFAIWGPFTAATAGANCPPVSGPTRCSYYNNSNGSGNTGLSGTVGAQGVSEGTSGDGFVGELTTAAGEVYILLVDNFSSSGSPYALSFGGSTVLGCTPITLPVGLSSFNGAAFNGQNMLRWTTENEYNSKDFFVEWTVDPLSGNWQRIGSIDAKIYSDVQSYYSLIHNSPNFRRINYYRLVQRDQDGYETTYTDKIVAIDNSDTRQVVRIVDLMGREADPFTNGIVIYIYDDGTTEKVFR